MALVEVLQEKAMRKRARYPDAVDPSVLKKIAHPVVKLRDPTQVEIDAQHVTEIVLAFANPALYKHGIRWRDAFTSDKTATYYCWDKPTSLTCWPQNPNGTQPAFVYYGQGVGSGAPSVAGNLPNRNNPLQLSNFLFMTSLRRSIRENKNPTGAYTNYDWYYTDGTKEFIVANPGDTANSMTTQIIPGGAVYVGGSAATVSTSNYQNAISVARGGFVNATAAMAVPGSNMLPFHGQFLPAHTFQGRYFIWNDGYSGSGGTQILRFAAAQSGSGNPTIGCWADSTNTALTQTVLGQTQTGMLAVCQGTTYIPADVHFAINVWRYNNKQPVLEYQVSGSVGTNEALPGAVLALFRIDKPDYYALEVEISNVGGTSTNAQSNTLRIFQINTGEIWAHTMTNQFNLQNFGSIVSSRCFGNSILATNTTAELYMAGTFAGAQPPAGTEWQYVVNGQNATDPYSYIIQQLGEQNRDFKKGAYGFVRPTEISQMKLQTSIIPVQGATGAAYIFNEPIADQPFYCLVLAGQQGAQSPQQVQFSFDENGEFVTRNQILETDSSRFTPEQWTLAMQVLSSMEQTYENNLHEKKIKNELVMNGLGKKQSLSPSLIETILKWAPAVVAGGKLAWQFMQPVLESAAMGATALLV